MERAILTMKAVKGWQARGNRHCKLNSSISDGEIFVKDLSKRVLPPRFKRYEETAMIYAFLLDLAGLAHS